MRGRCRGAPYLAHQLPDGGTPGCVLGNEQVAIGPVFELVPPGVQPVVEDLAAKCVAADAPGGPVLPALKVIVPGHQVIQVADLEGGMMKSRLAAGHLHEKEAVVVGGLLAAVAAHEGAERKAVRQLYLIRRDEAEPIFPSSFRRAKVCDR